MQFNAQYETHNMQYKNLIHNNNFIFFAILFFAAMSCHPADQKNDSLKKGNHSSTKNDAGKNKDTFLPDSSEVILEQNSSFKISDSFNIKTRTVWLDGNAFFKIKLSEKPFILHTGMLNIKTHEASFHINAHKENAGQSLKLFDGKMVVAKAYPSDYPDTVTIHAGEMILINKDIDLMEKETFDKRENN
jgi:ferric-dicitrate binding protein FerR (iron transport regulator)